MQVLEKLSEWKKIRWHGVCSYAGVTSPFGRFPGLGVTMSRFSLPLTLVAFAALSACNSGANKSNAESNSLGGANCVFDALDPFEPRSRLPMGDNKGKCHDTRKARSLVRLSAEDAQKYGGSVKDVLTVANISHKGKFYVGHIPLNSLKAAIFHLEYFPAVVPAGHTQLRLQFDEKLPVTLISQSKSEPTSVERVTDLVMSVEALGQPGFQYDIFKGMDNQFGAIYRLTSLEEKYDHMVRKQNHRVEQWKMGVDKNGQPGISHAELRTILEKYVAKSESLGMNAMYHTIKLNCTNEIMAALDDGIEYSLREKFGKFTAKSTDFYPNVIRISLIKRGLMPLGKGNDLPELKDDPVAAKFK
ncbi:MAG: hypothetical protein RLZZ488_635 [Pseudomonadota bacterium]|jgi:hypothetical protein